MEINSWSKVVQTQMLTQNTRTYTFKIFSNLLNQGHISFLAVLGDEKATTGDICWGVTN